MAFQLGNIAIKGLLVIVLLLIGLAIARLIRAAVVKILKTLKVDFLADRIELTGLLSKGNIKRTLSELIGDICYWFAILASVAVAINAIGLTVATDLLNRIILYIPNIIAAIFILILGILGATLLGNGAKTAAANAGVEQAHALGNIVKIIITVFTAIIALEQLAINMRLIEFTITIFVATLGLGTAIAFGLGCKDIAAEQMAGWLRKLKK